MRYHSSPTWSDANSSVWPGKYAKVPLGSGQLDLVDLLGDECSIRRDDLKRELCGKSHLPAYASFIVFAFSTASSIVPTM